MTSTGKLLAFAAAARSLPRARDGQKQGGTLTVGLELDIPGFDPLKVGVYDTAANIAAVFCWRRWSARRRRQGQAEAGALMVQFRRFQGLDFKLGPT